MLKSCMNHALRLVLWNDYLVFRLCAIVRDIACSGKSQSRLYRKSHNMFYWYYVRSIIFAKTILCYAVFDLSCYSGNLLLSQLLHLSDSCKERNDNKLHKKEIKNLWLQSNECDFHSIFIC